MTRATALAWVLGFVLGLLLGSMLHLTVEVSKRPAPALTFAEVFATAVAVVVLLAGAYLAFEARKRAGQ